MATLIMKKNDSDNKNMNVINKNKPEQIIKQILEQVSSVSKYGLVEENFDQFELKAEAMKAFNELKRSRQDSNIKYFSEKIIFLYELGEIYDQLVEKDELLQQKDKTVMLKKLHKLFEGKNYNQLNDLNRFELKDRIDKILAIEMLSGLFDDLSEEDKKIVEDASKRQPFFR